MCAVNGILNFSGNYIPCCCNLLHSACFRENRFDGSPVFSDENKYLNGHAAELHLSLPAASKRSTMRSQSVLSPGLDSICICDPGKVFTVSSERSNHVRRTNSSGLLQMAFPEKSTDNSILLPGA